MGGGDEGATAVIGVEQRGDQQQRTTRPRKTPYQGLLPYTEDDADYFFGRTAWSEIVTDHLLAYRVTLVYGPSGVGKSSLLRAGVVHELFTVARDNLVRTGRPELLPTIVSGWSGDPIAGVEAAFEGAARKLWGPLQPPAPSGSLREIVAEWTDRAGGRVLLVLDQFDEYFMYHESRPGGLGFVDELSDLIADREIAVNVLISIREDALAKLDRFDHPDVDLWQNLLRIDHLDNDAAREAITEPVKRWNEREIRDGAEITVEPELVDAVVAEANARAIRIGEAGRGVVNAEEPEPVEGSVEAPYLQLVMTRLWEEERRRGSSVLRVDTLNRRLGGAEQIVRRHFDDVMRKLPRRQRARAAKIMEYLVTPGGTKIALPPSALAKWSKQNEKKITPILATLAGGEQRILRTVTSPGDPKGTTSYEIFHDRLADGILDWRHRYVRRRRQTRGAVAALVLLLPGAFLALGFILAQQRHASNLSDKNAELEAQVAFLSEQSATAAAAQKSPFFRAMLPAHGDTVYSADFSPDGRFVVTGGPDDKLIVADSRTGKQFSALRPKLGGITRAVVSPRGNVIALEGFAERGLIISDENPQRRVKISTAGRFNSIAFDAGGNAVVTAGHKGSAFLWKPRNGRRQAFRPPGVKATSDTAIVSANGELVASVAHGLVRVWRVRGGALLKTLPVGTSPADILFSPHADLLVAVGRQRATIWTIGRWHATNLPGPPRTIPWFEDGGSPNLNRLASFSKGRIVIAGARNVIVSSTAGRRLATLPHHYTTTIARFSPDGTLIATGTAHGEVRVWTSAGRPLATLLPGRGSAVESLAFSPDGRLLVSAREDGTSTVWNIQPDLAVVNASTNLGQDGLTVLVRVENEGLRRSGVARLRLLASGASSTVAVRPLAPGARTAFEVRMPRRGSASKLVLVQLIPRDSRSDARQLNNEWSVPVSPPVQ